MIGETVSHYKILEELTKRYTANVEAYQLYLRGCYYWNRRSKEGFEQAIGHYNQAIQIDPGYALAYAGLADAFILQGVYRHVSGKEALQAAEKAAASSRDLDQSLAEAHVSVGLLATFKYDWAAAEKELLRGLALNPRYQQPTTGMVTTSKPGVTSMRP